MSGIKSNDDAQWDKFSSSPNIESIAVALSIDSSGDLFWKMISHDYSNGGNVRYDEAKAYDEIRALIDKHWNFITGSYKRRSQMVCRLCMALSITYEVMASAHTFGIHYNPDGKILVNYDDTPFEIDTRGQEDGEMICTIVNELKKRNII